MRENRVFYHIMPYNVSLQKIREISPAGIIFTGGLASTYEGKIKPSPEIFNLGIPILGICYGMQVISDMLGGKVRKAKVREYGNTEVSVSTKVKLFKGLPQNFICWISHGDSVSRMPKNFVKIASTKNTKIAAMNSSRFLKKKRKRLEM